MALTPYRTPVHTSSPNQCHSYKLSVFFLMICPGSASLFQAPRHPSPFFYHISSQNLTVITSYPYFLTSFSFKLRNLDSKNIFLVNEIKLFCFLFPPMVYSSVQIIIIYSSSGRKGHVTCFHHFASILLLDCIIRWFLNCIFVKETTEQYYYKFQWIVTCMGKLLKIPKTIVWL